TCVPSALSPAPRKGLMAFSAAFSMTMIMTGVASTGGNVASLKRLARWSGVTRRLKEPWAPSGIDCMGSPLRTDGSTVPHYNAPETVEVGSGRRPGETNDAIRTLDVARACARRDRAVRRHGCRIRRNRRQEDV